MTDDKTKQLKEKRDALMREAATAAYEYFKECDVGAEREAASDVYDNLRRAWRVN